MDTPPPSKTKTKKPKKPKKPKKGSDSPKDLSGKSTAETNEEPMLDENGDPMKDYKDEIVDELNKIMDIYKSAGEKGKVMGYRRAITNIKGYRKPIVNADQMDEIEFVGKGLKDKVRELMSAGRMSKLDELQGDDKIMALDALGKIWGVGSVVAQQLYDKGATSIEVLRQMVKADPEMLTFAQTVGLKYYDDFNERMQRAEAFLISETI